MKKLLFGIFIFFTLSAISQVSDEKLAAQFFENEEWNKALVLYEKLTEKDPTNFISYDRFIQCLIKTKEADKALKFVKKRAKKYPDKFQYKVDEGFIQEENNNKELAKEIYAKIIDKIPMQADLFLQLATAFERRNNLEYAIKTLEKAETNFPDRDDISSRLAGLYMNIGDKQKGIQKYVDQLSIGFMSPEQAKQMLEMTIIDSADFAALKYILLRKIQKNPEQYIFNDLLKWAFVKQKDWQGAFVQTRSLDKRLNENGARMVELGELCIENEAWPEAAQCFEYVMNLGENKPYYDMGVNGFLETKFKQIELTNNYNPSELNNLIAHYEKFIAHSGNNNYSFRAVSRLAELYINYLHNADKAIDLLEDFYKSPGIKNSIAAQCKLQLGDYYVISDDVWSSELLYGQVEKDFKEDPLGQEAKFRRAKLSYYRGDFDWCVLQLDVLKSATTQLISNNAIRLALTISENLGIDSNYDALERFANAELLIKQKKYDSAYLALDSIVILYPGHALSDDILLVKGEIKEHEKMYKEAKEIYETLAIAYKHDILGDDALYRLGLLCMNQLNEKAEAKKYFEQLLIQFPGSLHIIDVRKYYRKLRGDVMSE